MLLLLGPDRESSIDCMFRHGHVNDVHLGVTLHLLDPFHVLRRGCLAPRTSNS